MQFVKLQLGCLLVMAYIEITYIVATLRGKIPCNRFFDALMVVSPWAVFFDGFTAWTVNHMDIVPAFLNRGAQLLFLFLWILPGRPAGGGVLLHHRKRQRYGF